MIDEITVSVIIDTIDDLVNNFKKSQYPIYICNVGTFLILVRINDFNPSIE